MSNAIIELNSNLRIVLDIGLSIALILVFIYIVGDRLKKIKLVIYLSVVLSLLITTEIFGLTIFSSIINIVVITVILFIIVLHEGELKKVFQSNKKSKLTVNRDVESNDFQLLYKTIKDLVVLLSASKTGAIITFEKNDSLQSYIDEGVKVNATASVPLLSTIFYEGTALHDGAVVIRGTTIEAASVFYLPTTRALNGKYGARHRASLGISEVTDSLTVIVSEETGRISFAYQGELISSNRDDFLATFIELIEK